MSHAPFVSPQRALELLGAAYTYLDVRSEPEFDLGHPPGAFNVPWATVEGDRLVPNTVFRQVVSACFSSATPLIIGCHSGSRSRLASQALLEWGFESVAQLQHGFCGARDAFGRPIGGWSRAGLVTEQSATASQCYAALLARTMKRSSG